MTTTGESLIPYQALMERALRRLVREALDLAGTEGLPGNHHFFISFLTHAEGVEMPADLRARYADEMTIVLQHQFWGLETDETGFSVTLSFGGRSERLRIPFAALTAFMDPAVNFGLQFRKLDEAEGPRPDDGGEPGTGDKPGDTGGDDDPKSGTIVTLDKFRKK